MALVVPYFALKQGTRGKPVKALKRAVSKATGSTLLKWNPDNFTPIWGHHFTKTWARFQKEYLKVPVTREYDRRSHNALVSKFPQAYDAFAIKYLLEAALPKPPSKEELARLAMLANIMFFYNNRYKTSYRQWRPYLKVVKGGRVPSYGDCSGSGAGCAWGTGQIVNFNGYNWGYGNTWSQIEWLEEHGRRIPITAAELCDPIYYRGHVTWIIDWHKLPTNKPNKERPIVFSFGSYPARILDYDYRSDIVGCFSLFPVGR